MARAVGRAPRGAPLPQPLQALLLHQGRPAGVAARKEHDERGTGGTPVGRDKGALLDHAREEARCCVLSRPVLLAGRAMGVVQMEEDSPKKSEGSAQPTNALVETPPPSIDRTTG